MNINAIFLKSFRILLFPVALLYGLVVRIRNWMYDKGYFKSATFNFPLICVGNLSVGGTGKSPMVEYIVSLLHHDFKTATLSRGYKRRTAGYVLANETTTALEIGDEPMQFHIKFPDVAVAAGEERIVAIPQILHDKPKTEIIVLDDAFQHRSIKAGLNILLTDCGDLFTRDFFLPTGNLRDARASKKRAQIIIVSKCPVGLSVAEKEHILSEVKPDATQHVFFSTIKYGNPYHIINKEQRIITGEDEILLVTGIANPVPLKNYLHDSVDTYDELNYSDHHIFSIEDLKEITEKFSELQKENKYIITTEKDATRLIKFGERLQNLPFYVLPIEQQFLFGEKQQFNKIVMDYVIANKKTKTN